MREREESYVKLITWILLLFFYFKFIFIAFYYGEKYHKREIGTALYTNKPGTRGRLRKGLKIPMDGLTNGRKAG